MKRETLVCKCGREVGVVRLNAATLTFGHRINPRNERHPVQLAQTADERPSRRSTERMAGEDIRRPSEGLDASGPGLAGSTPAATGPSPRTTRRTRAESNGSPRTAEPSGA